MSINTNDSTEIKELHWMMDMLTNVDVGLVVLDASHMIQMWNRFMEDHSGILESEAKYKNIFGLFPELPQEWFEHKINSVFTLQCRAFSTWEQRPYLFKFKNYRPITGTEEFMYQNTTMIPLVSADGEINHVCLLIYDVTDEAVSQKEMQRLNNELEHISRIDRLTGLYNRGFWEESFQKEYERCKRYKTTSSALMFDIDHFKKVNDSYGHQAGDEVIRKTAKMVMNLIRKTDVAGRYGGEEFVIYLTNTSADNAKIFAERLRQNIEKMEVKYEALHIKITISIGICEFHESLINHEKWIEEADKALYLCKEHGRNQTRIKRFSEIL
jgi:diguanylate cyclase